MKRSVIFGFVSLLLLVTPGLAAKDYYKILGLQKPKETIEAPDFTLKNLSGQSTSLQSMRGKVVFINFWATWCVPCIQEMPTMEKLHREFNGKGLVILAVNFQETPKRIKAFTERHKFTFPILLDSNGRVSDLYQGWSLPMTVIVNKRGDIAGKLLGYRDWHGSEAKEFFKQLMEEKE